MRAIGVLSNPMLLWGIAFELVFAGAIAYVPLFQKIFNTASVSPEVILIMLPFPILVWGADEIRRWVARRRVEGLTASATSVARLDTLPR